MSHDWLRYLPLILGLHAISGACDDRQPSDARAEPSAPPYLVAFRLDDIQDWWLSEVQQAIIALFAKEQTKVTLGVIGGFFGEDKPLIDSIKRHREWLSFANHGLHAKSGADGKSVLLSQAADTTRLEISRSAEQIEKVLGLRPVTFIPHQNEYNAAVVSALRDLGIARLSGGCALHNGINLCTEYCGYAPAATCGILADDGLIHLPVVASTRWRPVVGHGMVPVADVMQEIENSVEQYCFAIVMLHPQDFATLGESVDRAQLGALGDLLRTVRSQADRFQVVPLDQVEPRCR